MKRRAPCATHGIPCRMGSREWAALPSSLRCCAAAARATAPRSTSATLACSLAHSSTASSRSSDQLAPAHRTAKLQKFHAALQPHRAGAAQRNFRSFTLRKKPRRAGAAPARAERAGGGKWRGAGGRPHPQAAAAEGFCVSPPTASATAPFRACAPSGTHMHTYTCAPAGESRGALKRRRTPRDIARRRRRNGTACPHVAAAEVPSIHPTDRARTAEPVGAVVERFTHLLGRALELLRLERELRAQDAHLRPGASIDCANGRGAVGCVRAANAHGGVALLQSLLQRRLPTGKGEKAQRQRREACPVAERPTRTRLRTR